MPSKQNRADPVIMNNVFAGNTSAGDYIETRKMMLVK